MKTEGPTVLGIDPGESGGAALIDLEGVIVGWACWRPSVEGYSVWRSHAERVSAPHLAAVAGLVWFGREAPRVALEKLHLQRGRSGILTLAEGAGEFIGVLRASRPEVEIVRVAPARWAKAIGGTGPTQTERAWAAMVRGPSGVPLPTGDRKGVGAVGSMESVGAIAEARLMALAVRS